MHKASHYDNHASTSRSAGQLSPLEYFRFRIDLAHVQLPTNVTISYYNCHRAICGQVDLLSGEVSVVTFMLWALASFGVIRVLGIWSYDT